VNRGRPVGDDLQSMRFPNGESLQNLLARAADAVRVARDERIGPSRKRRVRSAESESCSIVQW